MNQAARTWQDATRERASILKQVQDLRIDDFESGREWLQESRKLANRAEELRHEIIQLRSQAN